MKPKLFKNITDQDITVAGIEIPAGQAVSVYGSHMTQAILLDTEGLDDVTDITEDVDSYDPAPSDPAPADPPVDPATDTSPPPEGGQNG